MSFKRFKIYFLAIAFSIVASTLTFGTSVFYTGSDDITSFGPGYAELIVAGDSYSERFYVHEKDREIEMLPFFNAGTTISENHKTLMQAFNSRHRFILFSISVNDRHRGTHPMVFEYNLRELLNKSLESKKIVFFHTYMQYSYAPFASDFCQFSTYEYDSILRKLCAEYSNVYYIDMSDCGGLDYALDDGIHYSRAFNDKLYERLKAKIDEIRNVHNE